MGEGTRPSLTLRAVRHMFWHMPDVRHVKLFRNGRNQAVRIPRDMELPGEDAIIHSENGKLIIEPAKRQSLLEYLAGLEPLDETLDEIEELPLEPVSL